MTAVPSGISSAFLSSGATVQPGVGIGGDNGVGFHSNQPVRIERHDDTENVHNRDKLKQSDGDIIADGQIANYPKYPQSPYVRYVSRPLSHGKLVLSPQSGDPTKLTVSHRQSFHWHSDLYPRRSFQDGSTA